ncbi:MAG: ribonuclease R [Nitrospirota bacterium]
MITKETIAAFFKKVSRPVSFREISSQLQISKLEIGGLRRTLKELVNGGEIIRTRNGLYGPVEEMNLITGYFEAHKGGYGFVISEKPGERDVFISPRAIFGAMGKDRVVARIENMERRDGRIIRILERSHTRVVGTFEAGKTGFYVRPKNKSIPFDLIISPKERGGAKNGDNVIAEIINYPQNMRPPSARIIKTLERPDTPLAEVESIIDELNLPRRFPHEAHEEATALYSQPMEDAKKRKDLRGLPTVTIDGERAKDFDDAVSIIRTDAGYRLWVHIADVGHYVGWDSALDIEARKRGTSVYFPDRVVPMLPKELSEDLCSLKPKVDRLAFTVEMDFDARGEKIDAKFYPSIIISNERMTYTSVKKVLVDENPEERKRYDYLLRDFELMGEMCNILKARRIKRGSLDFDLPEPEVLLDIQGNPEAIIKAERNFAHMMIEEFMLSANEAVAVHLEGLGIPSLYRIHEEPDPLKMEDLIKVIHSTGVVKGAKTIRPKDFPLLLKKIKDTEAEEIINYMILRSLKQAKYSPANIGHFGLASESYTHFTSPIRRYPDLVVHRILGEALAKKRLSDKRLKELESLLPDIALHSSRMERQADEAERAVLDAMRVWFMRDKLGEEFEGKIVSVTPYGLKIRLKDYFVHGFLHVSFMTDDFYKYDEKTMSLHGIHKKKTYSIGEELTVRIDKVDMEEREIVLGLCG